MYHKGVQVHLMKHWILL